MTLGKLEPATLAQYANALVVRLEDSDWEVRMHALQTLGELKPAALAPHAAVVVLRLEDAEPVVCSEALETLDKLEPAALAQHAGAVVGKLNDPFPPVRGAALNILRRLPLVITRHIDFDSHNLRSRLLGRIAWYRCLLRLRVRRITLYWYALPYRPSGPGHARDVVAWGRMHEE